MSKLLMALQIGALLSTGAIIIEVALWSLWTDNTTVLTAILSAITVYAGLLSWVFLGDRDIWPRQLFGWAWQKLFSTAWNSCGSCVTLFACAIGGASAVAMSWPVSIHGLVTFDQKPVYEEVTVTCWTDNSQAIVTKTRNSRFEVPLSRSESDALVFITATSAHFRTQSLLQTKPGRVLVPLIRRHTLLVEVVDSSHADFSPEGVHVIAQEAAPGARPVNEKADNDGAAFFEANAGSLWRVSVVAGETYDFPFFGVDRIPYRFSADIASGKREESDDNAADISATSSSTVHTEVFTTQFLKSLTAGVRDVSASDAKDHDAQLVSWAPGASQLLVHTGYITSYNVPLKVPSWVGYTITGAALQQSRFHKFLPDPDLPDEVRSTPRDYTGSGYDRGTMASIGDMQFKGPIATKEANYMSVVCPQTPFLNRVVWHEIEEFGRRCAARYGKVYVFAGPAFSDGRDLQRVLNVPFIGERRVAVPTHFFRIHIADVAGSLQALCFLVPNKASLIKDISQYVVPMADIEVATGLTFVRTMDEPLRAALKSTARAELWPLAGETGESEEHMR